MTDDEQQKGFLVRRSTEDLVQKPIGLGVCVSATNPHACTAAMSKPVAMPTDSVA